MNDTAYRLLDPDLDRYFANIIGFLTTGKAFVSPVRGELRQIFKALNDFERLLGRYGVYEERHPLVFALSDLKLHVSILSEYLKGLPVEKVEVVEMVDFCKAQHKQLTEIAKEVHVEMAAVSNYSAV